MLDLGARGYGVAKGVPTMVVAAASFDDVLAIAGFGVCLALALADGGEVPLGWLIARAPVELASGVALGALLGALVAAPCVAARPAFRHHHSADRARRRGRHRPLRTEVALA